MAELVAKAERLPVVQGDLLGAFADFMRIDVAQGAASQDTLEGYRREAEAFVRWSAGQGVNPALAGSDDVKAYRRALVDQGLRPGTVAFKLAVVRRFYDAALSRGMIPENPAAGVKAPRESETAEERINYLSEAELALLFREVGKTTVEGKRDRAILALLSIHGLRTVEAHRLDVGDLGQVGGYPVLTVRGKGRGTRAVYLREDTHRAILDYLEARGGFWQGEPLFLAHSNRSKERLSRRGLRRIVDRYLNAAGIKVNGRVRSAHTLRHTAATLSLSKGAALEQVQAMLGHQDPKTTMVYAHVVDRAKGNPANLIAVSV